VARIDLDATPYRITACLSTAEGLPSNTVNAVCVDRRGQVWAATNGGVALIVDGRVRRRPADAAQTCPQSAPGRSVVMAMAASGWGSRTGWP